MLKVLVVSAALAAGAPLWQMTVGDHLRPNPSQVVVTQHVIYEASPSEFSLRDIGTGRVVWSRPGYGAPFFIDSAGILASSPTGIAYFSLSGRLRYAMPVCWKHRPNSIVSDGTVAAIFCSDNDHSQEVMMRVQFVTLSSGKVIRADVTAIPSRPNPAKILQLGAHRFGLANSFTDWRWYTSGVDLSHLRLVNLSHDEVARTINAPTWGCVPKPKLTQVGSYRVEVCDHGPIDIKVFNTKP